MEAILNSGFFWGLMCCAFVVIVGIVTNRPKKMGDKQTAQ